MDEVTRLARARGCLLGGAIGDALGAPVEFWSRNQIEAELGQSLVGEMLPAYGRNSGAITDDTQMLLFVAEGLVDADSPHDATGSVHRAMRRWYTTQTESFDTSTGEGLIAERWLWSRRAPGNTCLSALRTSVPIGGRASNDSKGCGTVMRSAPFGFTSQPLAWAAESSDHTHGHPTAAVSAAFLAQVIADLVSGLELPDAVEATRHRIIDTFPDAHTETTHLVDEALTASRHGTPDIDAIESLGAGWIAEEALAISLLVALTGQNWKDALSRAVSHSGDSDSTGAIVGNLLGAAWGDEDLPEDWLGMLEGRATIERLADELARLRI